MTGDVQKSENAGLGLFHHEMLQTGVSQRARTARIHHRRYTFAVGVGGGWLSGGGH